MLLPRPIQRVATGRRVGHVERHLGHVTPPRSRSVKHLTNVIAALRANPSINSVERARG